jgi:hypothetical protein
MSTLNKMSIALIALMLVTGVALFWGLSLI